MLHPFALLIVTSLLAGLSWIGGCSESVASQEEEAWRQPNFVILMAEDIGLQLGAYGDDVAVTPTIDALAADGMRYDLAFAPSGVCAPARTSLMMGTYPSTIGGHHMRAQNRGYDMVPPPDMKGYAEVLRAAGYYTTNNAKTDYQMGGPSGTPPSIWDEVGNVDWRGRADGQPFLAVFTLFDSHESRLSSPTDGTTDPASVVVPPYYPDTPVVREDYVRYYDNIATMDAAAADILDRLEADGLTESTVVVFIGDNGAGFPRDKRWPYDGGIHVPMVVRFPGRIEAGTVNEELVSFVDFAPTMLSLAGIEIPDHMPGRVFLGPRSEPEPDYVYAGADRHREAEDRIRIVRDRRYKYVRHYRPGEPYGQPIELRDNLATMQEIYRLEDEGELFPPARWFFETKPEEELYDTLEDPFEIDNRIDDPTLGEVLSRMREAHERWRDEFDVWGDVPEAQMAEQFWPNGEQPVTGAPVIDATGGGLNGVATVTLESPTEGASIEYTLDRGPDPRWRLYTGAFEVEEGETVRARAVRYGFSTSEETTALVALEAQEKRRISRY